MAAEHPLLIGPNYEIVNSLYEVIENNPYYTCQVMIGNRNITKTDREATAMLCLETGKRLYIHTHLHNNLAKADARQDLRALKHDLSIIRGSPPGREESMISRIPGAAVLHVGKACEQTPKGKETGGLHGSKIRKKRIGDPRQPRVAQPTCLQHGQALTEVIRRLNDLTPYVKTGGSPILLLENAAGQGTELGSSWDDFRKIAEGLDHNYLGICLDTQHAFAAGLTNWSTHEETNKILDEALATGFPVELIHLNDSKVPFNSKIDRHDSIGQGYIWKDNQDSLIELLARCAEEDRGIVLETPTQMPDLDYIYANFVAE